jgi:hypothetical protein
MKVLYLLKKEPDNTLETFFNVQRRSHDITVIDIRENKNYPDIIKLIENSDRVISW